MAGAVSNACVQVNDQNTKKIIINAGMTNEEAKTKKLLDRFKVADLDRNGSISETEATIFNYPSLFLAKGQICFTFYKNLTKENCPALFHADYDEIDRDKNFRLSETEIRTAIKAKITQTKASIKSDKEELKKPYSSSLKEYALATIQGGFSGTCIGAIIAASLVTTLTLPALCIGMAAGAIIGGIAGCCLANPYNNALKQNNLDSKIFASRRELNRLNAELAK